MAKGTVVCGPAQEVPETGGQGYRGQDGSGIVRLLGAGAGGFLGVCARGFHHRVPLVGPTGQIQSVGRHL